MEGKDVLVVAYNITLWHYLRYLAYRYPDPGTGRTNRITWMHFHGWCKRVCDEAGASNEYKMLRQKQPEHTDNGKDEFFEQDLPQLVHRILDRDREKVRHYDAILVDEGQDFNLDWWNALRKVLRPDGEMLLAADGSQDIYGRARAWTDDAMTGAGFTGDWFKLKGSYRLPEKLVPLLRRYVQEYLPELEQNLPEAIRLDQPLNRQLELPTEPVKIRWIQVRAPEHTVEASVWAFQDTPRFADPWRVHISDITLLTAANEHGQGCVESLQSKNIDIAHIFDEDWKKAQGLKHAFFMEDGRAKACTIHSFKGWETRAIIVLIGSAKSIKDRALLYVAMTRLKRHVGGSVLTVVCSAPELEEYGKTWPDFQYYQDEEEIDWDLPF